MKISLLRNFSFGGLIVAIAASLSVGVPAAAQQIDSGGSSIPQKRAESRRADRGEIQSRHRQASRDPFAAGKWLFTGYGSAAVGKTSRQIYAARWGLGYHVANDLSLNLEGVGYLINQERNTGAIGLDLLPRWHYLRSERWSMYADGGGGVIYSGKRMGNSGTHFNFTLQGGVGATYDAGHQITPMAGIRWFHISNARIQGKARNVGFDSPLLYLGLMFPF
ncbi:MAG: acyloxyacyl hydrolase [Candidatus Binatia bacterium]